MASSTRNHTGLIRSIITVIRGASDEKRDSSLILFALAAITILHYFTPLSYFTLHNLYRNLFFIPIILAAVRFSLRGGILVAIAASILYIPHVALYYGNLPVEATNDLQQIALFNIIGLLAGFLVEAERKQRERYRQTALELESSIGELQRHTNAVEGMRSYFGNILDSLSCGVVTLDLQRRVTLCNPAANFFLGDRIIGKSFEEIARSVFALDSSTLLSRASEGQLQIEIQRGRRFPITVAAAPLRTKEGSVIGSVVILEDITELKDLESQFLHAERLSSLGNLAGSLAHEIRNPLGIIRASAQMLDSELTSPDQKECTGVITQEIDRIERLVQQLLAFARPHEPNFGIINPSRLLTKIEPLLKTYANHQGINFTLDMEDSLPAVNGDEEMIEQCVINLVLNAIEAMSGEGSLRITASTTKEEDQVGLPTTRLLISVADTGPGIDEAELTRIFEPFYSTKATGTGLGLAIVKRIVEAHNGQITLRSDEGRGSIFTLVLPGIEGRSDG